MLTEAQAQSRNAENIPANDSEWITPEDFWPLWKISRNWLYQRVHAGTLPFKHYKFGHYLRFKRSEVEQWLERQAR